MASTNEVRLKLDPPYQQKDLRSLEPDDRTAEQRAYAAISAVQREADQRVTKAEAGMKAAWEQCDMLNKQLAKKDDIALRLYHKMQSDLASLTALRDELDIQIADQARTLRDFVEQM